MSHTPGPWKIVSENDCYFDIAGNDRDAVAASPLGIPGEVALTRVCRVHKHKPGKANAALIAAAPELRAALEAVLLLNEIQDAKWNFALGSTMKLVTAALAKATGGQP